MTAEDYQAAFHGIDLPKSLELFPGTNIPDVQLFLSKSIHILKTNPNDRIKDPVRYRLDKVLEMIQQQ